MSDSNSLINIGELSKPATVLIEKISDAIGGLFKPWQMRRVAQAEAETEKISALSRIEVSELEQRSLHRLLTEEAMKQANMESITRKALPGLQDDARPNEVEDDWLTNFFEKCRLISDHDMQKLWARVLSGEANKPGTFSKRTVDFIGTLDKSDATLFTNLCSYIWTLPYGCTHTPLIYDVDDAIYKRNGIYFSSLKHLDSIGLITFDSIAGYTWRNLPEKCVLYYHTHVILLSFKKPNDNKLKIGHTLLTKTGQELAPIAADEPIPEFLDYVIARWSKEGHIASSPWPRVVLSQTAPPPTPSPPPG